MTQTKDDGCRVTLFSDDPPEAVREGFTGNSFYFAFTLPADAADDLAGQHYEFRGSAAEQDDTTSGLFIAADARRCGRSRRRSRSTTPGRRRRLRLGESSA